MRSSAIPRIEIVLLAALASTAGCKSDIREKPGGSADLRSEGDPDPDDAENPDGSDGTDGSELRLTVDSPAFYSEGRTVEVSGTATAGDDPVDEVLVAGVAVNVEEGRFVAEVDLGAEPWAIVSVSASHDDDTRAVLVQAAQALDHTSPLAQSEQTRVDRDALDALGAHIARFANPDDFAPAADRVLAERTCVARPAPGLEPTTLTESLVAVGTADLDLDVAIDPSTGALAVNLERSRVAWDLEQHITLQDGGTAVVALTATAVLGDTSLAAAGCGALGLPMDFDAADHTWELDQSNPFVCLDADQSPTLSSVYAEVVLPAASSAVCDWAGWLPTALDSDLTGVNKVTTAEADASGLTLNRTSEGTAAKVAPTEPVTTDNDGLDSVLAASAAGLALDAALHIAASTAPVFSITDDGQTTELRIVGVAGGTATLGATQGGSPATLLAPVQVELTIDDAVCQTFHIVPNPSPITLGASGTGQFHAAGTTLAGYDAVLDCDVDGDSLASLAEQALTWVDTQTTPAWATATGLQALGADPSGTLDVDVLHQAVSVPLP